MVFPILLDLIILVIVVLCVWRGYRRGAFMSLSGVVSLLAGIFGASWLARRFAEPVARALFLPQVERAFEGFLEEMDFSAMGESLLDALGGLGTLPFFSSDSLQPLLEQAAQSGKEMVTEAAMGVAAQFAAMLIFIVALILIVLLVQLLFRAVNLIFKLPVIGTANRVAGAALGLVMGLLLSAVLLWAASSFVPIEIFSAQSLEQTYVAQPLLELLNTVTP